MSEKIPYLRVGTTYYKTIEKPLISGDKISILVRWNRETIISDHGKVYVSKVPKYDGSVASPLIYNTSKSFKDSTILIMKSLTTLLKKISALKF